MGKIKDLMKTNEKFRTEMWKDKSGNIHIVNRILTNAGHHTVVQKPDGSQEPEKFISSDELETITVMALIEIAEALANISKHLDQAIKEKAKEQTSH